MRKTRSSWPDIVFGGGSQSSRISRAVARGDLTKIGPTLYTPKRQEAPERAVERHRWSIAAHYVPGAVVTHRTAFEGRPTPDGTVFLTGPVARRLDIPGLHLRAVRGPGVLPGDQPFVQGLTIASEPRLLLENLGLARQRGAVRRTVMPEAVEERLETILRSRGEAALNQIRDQARELAPALGAERAMARLDRLIGALLRSRPAEVLRTRGGRARAAGLPADPERLERFDLLARSLPTLTPPLRPDPLLAGPAFEHLAFFDAYFSNYIEGTEFEVEEARAIVFDGLVPERRPADAHDILGTYRLVGDAGWLSRAITQEVEPTAFLTRLREAHAILLAGRPEVHAGEWKTKPNQAGGTRFVEPELVEGTLVQAWEVARHLPTAFTRAAMIMFILTEVHPFSDGNGRIARAFMNAELVAARERRIVIPTVFRDDYLGALRSLSRQDEPRPFLLMLDQAQRFTASIRWEAYPRALDELAAANAFTAPEPGVRLRIPRTAV